jgi:hypothetical protein
MNADLSRHSSQSDGGWGCSRVRWARKKYGHEKPQNFLPQIARIFLITEVLARQSRNQKILTKSWSTKSFLHLADMLKARQQPDKNDLFMILSVMILSRKPPSASSPLKPAFSPTIFSVSDFNFSGRVLVCSGRRTYGKS